MLKALDIDKYFKYIIGHDMVKNPKPASDMILKTLAKLDIKQQNAILIGDSQKDKRAAQNANIKFILVNWGFSEDDKNAVNSIEELENKLMETIK